ncbi:MAG: ATP-binding protein [candidate division KSB1 bacterium]|nr:ATP-binding protein [candidate division KSB1 bacterium]
MSLQLPEKDINIHGNRSQLSRVFLNMINNAVDSIEENGEIKINVSEYYAEKIPNGFPDCKTGNYVKIDISDTGQGIDMNILKDIFEPFFTTKNMSGTTGSGLGLTIAREIISDHSGFITVSSRINQGCTFSLYLPIESAAKDQKESSKRDSLFTQYKQAACY